MQKPIQQMLGIERAGRATCMLTHKEDVEGCFVLMDDGSSGFLSWKGLQNFVQMRTNMRNGKPEEATLFGSESRPA